MPSSSDVQQGGTEDSEISSRLIKLTLEDEDTAGELPFKEQRILDTETDGGGVGKVCTVIEEQIVAVKVVKLTKQLHISGGVASIAGFTNAQNFQRYSKKGELHGGCSNRETDMVKETRQQRDQALEKLCGELASLSISKQLDAEQKWPGAIGSTSDCCHGTFSATVPDVSDRETFGELEDIRLEHICPTFKVEPDENRWKGIAALGGRPLVEATGCTKSSAKEAAANEFMRLLIMTPTWARLTRGMGGCQIILELNDNDSPDDLPSKGKRRHELQDCLIPTKKYKVFNV